MAAIKDSMRLDRRYASPYLPGVLETGGCNFCGASGDPIGMALAVLVAEEGGWCPPNPSREMVAKREQYWMDEQVGHEQGPADEGSGEKMAEGFRVDLGRGGGAGACGGPGIADDEGVSEEPWDGGSEDSLKSNTSPGRSAGTDGAE